MRGKSVSAIPTSNVAQLFVRHDAAPHAKPHAKHSCKGAPVARRRRVPDATVSPALIGFTGGEGRGGRLKLQHLLSFVNKYPGNAPSVTAMPERFGNFSKRWRAPSLMRSTGVGSSASELAPLCKCDMAHNSRAFTLSKT